MSDTTETKTTPVYLPDKYWIIKPATVRRRVNVGGKRISREALDVLDRHVGGLVYRATQIHNGGRKTIDAAVMQFIISPPKL